MAKRVEVKDDKPTEPVEAVPITHVPEVREDGFNV